jgi:hypothetical protein
VIALQHQYREKLGQDVAEKELEIPQQAAAKHQAGDSHLNDGMHEPQHVVENLGFFAQASGLRAADTFSTGAKTPLPEMDKWRPLTQACVALTIVRLAFRTLAFNGLK